MTIAAVVVAACTGGAGDSRSGSTVATTIADSTTSSLDNTTTTTPADDLDHVVDLRPLSTSADARIVDDLDREVLLRGANVNSLGEYWQGDPDHPPTIPVSDDDWDAMAAHGFSVVRLLISWSRLEPERGLIDDGYLDEIDRHVTAAAERGIYTVIDMHQDAFSATIFTDNPAECGPGTTPAKGWDGAPAWATITDGLATCLPGDRNSSPAVLAAWNHFYDDTDGIRTEFATAWGAVATRFAGRPEVAGYDLLNEPETSRPAEQLAPLYGALIADTAAAIRAAEAAAPFEHLLIVEPAIPTGNPTFGIVVPDPTATGFDTRNVVAGPHNYAGSITEGDPVAMSDLFAGVAGGLGLPLWIGEYGYFGRDDGTATWPRAFAADQDRRAQGGAWWQWRQACGDPHSIGYDQPASGEIVQLNPVSCPGDVALGPDDDFLRVVGRTFPRAAPGRITDLVSDPDSGAFELQADAATAGTQLVVWAPTDATTHSVSTSGLRDVVEHTVPGGRIITAVVSADGAYSFVITPV